MIKSHPVFKISNKIMILIFIPMIISESCCVIIGSTYTRINDLTPLNSNTADLFYLAMNICDFITLFFFAYLIVKVTSSDEFLHISMLLLRKDVKLYVLNRDSKDIKSFDSILNSEYSLGGSEEENLCDNRKTIRGSSLSYLIEESTDAPKY